MLEIAKSEIGYTGQRPVEFATTMFAAAIKEGYNHLVYLKGDHFQVALKDYQKDPVQAIENAKKLIREAIEKGYFYQIDLDMSPLVDYTKTTRDEQQKLNYEFTAKLTRYVRDLERELGLDKQGIVVNLAGEIGEIGMGMDKGEQQNSTVDELEAFMNGYKSELRRLSQEAGYELKPITIIAVQTGTKHGGVRDAQGKITKAKVGFNTLGELGKVAREDFGLAGAVQHGASTLPEDYFILFAGNPVPEGTEIDESLLNTQGKQNLNDHPVAEVHLATAYQDTILEHSNFPAKLLQEIRAYVLSLEAVKKEIAKGVDENKAYTDGRKNAWGPFKLHVWNMPEEIKVPIRNSLEKQFDTVFNNLGVANKASSSIDGKKGGIDFRQNAMVINYQPMGNFASLKLNLPALSEKQLALYDVDKELTGLETMVEREILPSGERIKEVLAASSQKGQMGANRDRMIALLVKVGILEETQCCLDDASQGYKEALVLADSLV